MLQRDALKEENGGWVLKDQEGGVLSTFKSKAEATGGELESPNHDRNPTIHEQPKLARLMAVVIGVIGFFGLIFLLAQQ